MKPNYAQISLQKVQEKITSTPQPAIESALTSTPQPAIESALQLLATLPTMDLDSLK